MVEALRKMNDGGADAGATAAYQPRTACQIERVEVKSAMKSCSWLRGEQADGQTPSRRSTANTPTTRPVPRDGEPTQ